MSPTLSLQSKAAALLSVVSIAAGVAVSAHQYIEMKQQGAEQLALAASVVGSLQAEAAFLRAEIHQTRLELFATQHRLADLEAKVAGGEEPEDWQDEPPANNEAELPLTDDDSVPPTSPSFEEMREKAAQGKVWQADGSWADL